MTAKEYLSRPKELEEEIRRDQDNLAAMNSIIGCCTTNLSFIAGTNPSRKTDTFESVMLFIVAEKARIKEKIRRLAEMELEVLTLIKTLQDADLQAVMIAKYIDRLTWGNIGKKAHLSARHAQRLEEALKELENSSFFAAQCRTMSLVVAQ